MGDWTWLDQLKLIQTGDLTGFFIAKNGDSLRVKSVGASNLAWPFEESAMAGRRNSSEQCSKPLLIDDYVYVVTPSVIIICIYIYNVYIEIGYYIYTCIYNIYIYISQSILGHLNQPAAPGPERGGLLLSGDCLNATHAMGGAHHRPATWKNLEDVDWFCWESLQKIMIFTRCQQGLKWGWVKTLVPSEPQNSW